MVFRPVGSSATPSPFTLRTFMSAPVKVGNFAHFAGVRPLLSMHRRHCAVVARHIPEGGGLKQEDFDWELDTTRPRIQMQSLQSVSDVVDR